MNAFTQIHMARAIAIVAHADQSYGETFEHCYFSAHVAKVAENVTKAGGTADAIAAAYLHDVLEDTAVEAGDLREAGISERVIEIISTLTRQPGREDYWTYIRRVREADDETVSVKLADLRANLAQCEVDGNLGPGSLGARYAHAIEMLTGLYD